MNQDNGEVRHESRDLEKSEALCPASEAPVSDREKGNQVRIKKGAVALTP
jgi:hypothetical protein